MPNEIDLSDKALRTHLAIAVKATPGPWVMQIYNGGPYPGPFQIWSQSAPNSILVSISVEGSRNCAHIAANAPDVVKAHVGEILRLRSEVKRLEKEVVWLAARCHEFCDFNNYCNECALYPGNINFPHPDCGVKLVDEGRSRARFMKHTVDWREAVRKAVEASHA